MVGYKAKKLNNAGTSFIELNDNGTFGHYSSINQKGYKTLQDGQSEKFNPLNVSTSYQSSNVLESKSQIIV